MRSSISILTAALCFLSTTTTALPLEKRLVEEEPWHLTNLAVFTANNGFKNSSIAFNFLDSNAGLQLNTTCSRSVAGAIEDGSTYYSCQNNAVAFRWNGNILDVRRYYKDESVGPCPLYCTVTAYGHATPNLVLDYLAEDGKGTHQDAIDVPVTEMVAK